MSIFNPNYKLLNKYITEADTDDEDDFSIDDKQFDDDSDSNSDVDKSADDIVNRQDDSEADKAADDLVNNDKASDNNSETDKAADDIVNDNNDENTDTESDGNDSNDSDSNDSNTNNSDDSDDNFDINLDGDGDDQGDGENGSDSTGDDTGSDSDSGDDVSGDSSEGVTSDLVDKEKEIFSDLTEDQMKIKVKELKESYTTFLEVIDDINSRITAIPKNSANIKILKFISSKLLELKKIANDYLISSFPTKTYIENVIFYQTSLAQLNTIKKVLEEMADKSENKDNKKAKK